MAAKSKKDDSGSKKDTIGREIRNRKQSMNSESVRALGIKLSKPSSILMQVADDMDALEIDEIKATLGGIETAYEALISKIFDQFESKTIAEARRKGVRDRRATGK